MKLFKKELTFITKNPEFNEIVESERKQGFQITDRRIHPIDEPKPSRYEVVLVFERF